MARYSIEEQLDTFASARTILYASPNSLLTLELISARVGARGVPANENLQVAITRSDGTSSGTGTTVTPAKWNKSDAAAAGVYKSNLTGAPTTFESQHMVHRAVPSLVGFVWEAATRSDRIIIRPDEGVSLRILVAPTSVNLICELHFELLG